MTYDLDTLIELENFLGPTTLTTLRDLHTAGYRVVKYDADEQLSPAPVCKYDADEQLSPAPVCKYDADEQPTPSPRKFKVGDRVRPLTGYYEGKVGVVILDDGDPEIETPYPVKIEGESFPFMYCAHELEPAQEVSK